ncbi:hypothetical protein Sjap_007169 [Stephania japonica]|uniref:Uncharacterized protein n=1 Tax=Stephania japonica TaxID=461633 RepID=A0AAP0JPA7_9MAGN|nr:COMT protein [Stephania japonica]
MGSIENNNNNNNNDTQEDQIFFYANHLMTSPVLPRVLQAIIELDVLEIIARAGPSAQLTPSQIVSQIPTTNPNATEMLERMLRVLASYSILTWSSVPHQNGDKRRYGLGPVCKYFVRDENGASLVPLFMLSQDKLLLDAWYCLKDSFLEGGIPFEKKHGMSIFDYMGTNERCNQLFNEATFSHTTILMKNILERYKGFDDEKLKVVVDLGGGYGITIKNIIARYPKIKGVNFDLPHVIARAPKFPGVENIGGDMFASIPKGDAIFMKNILHDWRDEQCLKILKNSYETLPQHGKVIAVETILPPNPSTDVKTRSIYELDLIMMNQEGKERTIEEFEVLAKKAGFAGFKPVCSALGFTVLEFYKRV